MWVYRKDGWHSQSPARAKSGSVFMLQSDNGPLRSEFSDDPDMTELVIEYVEKMPQRVHSMVTAFETSSREQLIRIVHQLKGSGGGYGFPQLTTVADRLEQRLLSISDQELSTVDPEFRALIELCGRMAA